MEINVNIYEQHFKLKKIEWTQKDGVNYETRSPTHIYVIRIMSKKLGCTCTYFNLHTKSTDSKQFNEASEAKQWVENVHIPAKLLTWFNKI